MTTTTASTESTARRTVSAFGYSATLLPRSVAALARARDGRGRAGAVLGCALGVVGLVEVLLLGLFVFRGVLYGLVDQGPYDDAWGGPSRAGAWATHFAVGLGVGAAAVLLGLAVTWLHRRAGDRLAGRPAPAWVLPVCGLVCAGVALFLVAFVRQL